jgi:hypothetical protein
MMLVPDSLRDLADAPSPALPAPPPGRPAPGPAEEELELFRRAVCERDRLAWETAISRHRWLIAAWLRQHPSASQEFGSSEEDCRIDRVFERFWRAVTPDRFGSFASFARLLAYLKLCAHSAILDEARRAQARDGGRVRLISLDQEGGERLHAEAALHTTDVESEVLERLDGHELWRAVVRALPDECTRQVVYLSFAMGLTPRQIHGRYPARYPRVADVYRIKQNALRRLRRSPAIQALEGAA